MNYVQIRMPQDNVPAFLAYLGIGVLQAISDGTVPPEIGIWTLGVPKVWEHFADDQTIPPEIIHVFQTSDELSALQQLAPEHFAEEVSKLVSQLYVGLTKAQTTPWRWEWIEGVASDESD